MYWHRPATHRAPVQCINARGWDHRPMFLPRNLSEKSVEICPYRGHRGTYSIYFCRTTWLAVSELHFCRPQLSEGISKCFRHEKTLTIKQEQNKNCAWKIVTAIYFNILVTYKPITGKIRTCKVVLIKKNNIFQDGQPCFVCAMCPTWFLKQTENSPNPFEQHRNIW